MKEGGGDAKPAEVQCDWKEFTSPDGRKYYYNRVTKSSVWQMPEELKRAQALAAGSKPKAEGNSIQAGQSPSSDKHLEPPHLCLRLYLGCQELVSALSNVIVTPAQLIALRLNFSIASSHATGYNWAGQSKHKELESHVFGSHRCFALM